LLDRALELAAVQPGDGVADIYGGVGLFGLFMASSGADVTVVEIDPRAVAAAQETARAWGLTNLTFVASSAADAMAGLPGIDLALVDPPRTGLDLETLGALIERRVPRIVYVSCSPISYARDAAHLVRAGYRIERYELFDFYPQTVHVEGLALFTRND
jgi:tRNA/tmRNA/rRNA uracil-C5-methylase (TrmA/RlmC/RlmD family)